MNGYVWGGGSMEEGKEISGNGIIKSWAGGLVLKV